MENTDCGWYDALAVRMLRCCCCCSPVAPQHFRFCWCMSETDKIPAWNGRKCCTPSIAKHLHRLYSRGNLRIFIFWVNFSRCKAANQLHHFGCNNVHCIGGDIVHMNGATCLTRNKPQLFTVASILKGLSCVQFCGRWNAQWTFDVCFDCCLRHIPHRLQS